MRKNDSGFKITYQRVDILALFSHREGMEKVGNKIIPVRLCMSWNDLAVCTRHSDKWLVGLYGLIF